MIRFYRAIILSTIKPLKNGQGKKIWENWERAGKCRRKTFLVEKNIVLVFFFSHGFFEKCLSISAHIVQTGNGLYAKIENLLRFAFFSRNNLAKQRRKKDLKIQTPFFLHHSCNYHQPHLQAVLQFTPFSGMEKFNFIALYYPHRRCLTEYIIYYFHLYVVRS